jgi:hypothetical protein
VHRARKEGVDRLSGRGRSLGFLGNGVRRNQRIESRLARVIVGVRRDDLDMMTMRGRIDTVLDPETKTERTDTAHDLTRKGVNDTAQQTGMIGKTVNLPDRDSTEIGKNDQGHASTGTHHLDQNRVNLLGMVIPNPDLGRGRGMIGIDVQ